MPKRCEKPLFDQIKVVLWKEPRQKTSNIGKKRAF